MPDDCVQVLHLIDTYRIGGPGKTIINSARFISGAYRIHVSSFVSRDASQNEFASAVRAADIPYLPLLETRRLDMTPVRELRDYVRAKDIRILHTHGYRSDVVGYLLSFVVPKLRVVTTHHGWIRNSAKQALVARVAIGLSSRLHGVSCVSAKLLEELPRALQSNKRAAVIHNAIVVQDYQPRGRRAEVRATLGLTDEDTLFGVIGRLSPEKGVTDVLEAFSTIAHLSPRTHLAYVGEGPMRPAIERMVAERSLSQRVHLIGHWHPIQPFYEATDVVVSPSWTEGLSNVLLESMAMERPIVATRAGGNDEIVEEGVSALLVPVGDTDALAAAMRRLVEDSVLAGRLAAAGLARVQRQFSFEARMEKEVAFYERILARQVTQPAAQGR
jgi:glycosyltransferase involved in cell wall biosynthesis